MKNAEQIMKKKSLYRAEIEKNLPENESDALWQKAMERLGEYLDRYSSLPKGVHMHTDNKILPGAAIYLTLKEAIGQEKAYMVMKDAAVLNCAKIAKKLQKLMKLPGMQGMFLKAWDPLAKKLFGAANGFQNVFYPKKKGEYRMDVTACPYARYFTELGCPELTALSCDSDEWVYGDLPGIRFERTGTIGKGAERCDFCLRRLRNS